MIQFAQAASKIIVLDWVSDEDTKLAYEGNDDAYRVFRKMRASGHPSDDGHELLAEARNEGLRLQQLASAYTL